MSQNTTPQEPHKNPPPYSDSQQHGYSPLNPQYPPHQQQQQYPPHQQQQQYPPPQQQPYYPPHQQQPYYPPPMPMQQMQSTSNVVVVNSNPAPVQTVVVKQGVNHCLHCCITIFFFPWIIVWMILKSSLCEERPQRRQSPVANQASPGFNSANCLGGLNCDHTRQLPLVL